MSLTLVTVPLKINITLVTLPMYVSFLLIRQAPTSPPTSPPSPFPPQARGYPCSLWLLFHSLVAHSTDATALSALYAIRGYVDHFFGCDLCRRHFVGLFDAGPPKGVSSVDGAALWLWRAHNAVNHRLNQSGVWAEGGTCHETDSGTLPLSLEPNRDP